MVMAPRDIVCEDKLTTASEIEPLDLDEVKKDRRFSSTSLDTRFDVWVSKVRQQWEQETGVQCNTATRLFLMERLPVQPTIYFWRAPVQEIVSFVYLIGGVETTLDPATYAVYPPMLGMGELPNPSGVQLVDGASWPSTDDRPGSVRITYLAGYGDSPGDVPEFVRETLMTYLGDAHKYRETLSDQIVSKLPGAMAARDLAWGKMTPVKRLTRW